MIVVLKLYFKTKQRDFKDIHDGKAGSPEGLVVFQIIPIMSFFRKVVFWFQRLKMEPIFFTTLLNGITPKQKLFTIRKFIRQKRTTREYPLLMMRATVKGTYN
jgi:hypothetical protein